MRTNPRLYDESKTGLPYGKLIVEGTESYLVIGNRIQSITHPCGTGVLMNMPDLSAPVSGN